MGCGGLDHLHLAPLFHPLRIVAFKMPQAIEAMRFKPLEGNLGPLPGHAIDHNILIAVGR